MFRTLGASMCRGLTFAERASMRDIDPAIGALETDEYPSLSHAEVADENDDFVDIYSDVHERPTLIP